MKDKIEVGEYVRTKDGRIDKVDRYSIGCCVYHCKNGMCIDECETVGIPISDIKKHSSNIKELVEEGDIVKLEYYVRKYGKRITRRFEIKNISDEVLYFDNRYCSFCYDLKQHLWRDGKGYNPKLKSIVTKEQFKNREYLI